MAQRQTYLTRDGLANLESELHKLITTGRQDIATRIQIAKEVGGTADNAEFEDAKKEQSFIEGRILALEGMLNSAVIIDYQHHNSDFVVIGSRVKVMTQTGEHEEYSIVGSAEAAPLSGRISNESPIGRCLLDRSVGDEVETETPAGKIKLTILEII